MGNEDKSFIRHFNLKNDVHSSLSLECQNLSDEKFVEDFHLEINAKEFRRDLRQSNFLPEFI